MSIQGYFLHVAISDSGILESVCLVCRRSIVCSAHEEELNAAENAHKCLARNEFQGDERTLPDPNNKAA